MKIVINNVEFPYNEGCKVLKLKHDSSPFPDLEDIWDDIIPMTFGEMTEKLSTIEQRRVAISCLGIDRLTQQVEPKLLATETISKKTTWVSEDGKLVDKKFKDTYQLYEVTAEKLGIKQWNTDTPYHFVKCKDTSTDREYTIWVDAFSVHQTNAKDDERGWRSSGDNFGLKIRPIQAIAWTIQTDIVAGGIEKIVRQGDCILIKKNKDAEKSITRHLTEEEYRTLLVLES